MRKAFYILNFAILGLLVASAAVDQQREWKVYQEKYRQLDIERLTQKLAAAKSEDSRKAVQTELSLAKHRPLEIKQVMVDELGRIDRCITCHVGMDEFTNPTLSNDYKGNPYKAHPGNILKSHPISKFGCTSCHSGQGLALTAEAAHGFIEHWEQPILKSPYIEANCVKCHANFEKLPGTQTAALGKKLFEKNGCIGCHSLKGVGGVISVDLYDIADKPLSRIDFSHTGLARKDWNIQNWIELHFTKDTMEMTPGDPEGHLGEPIPPSGMPPFYKEFKKEEAQALTAYLLSMTAQTVPHNYYVYAPAPPEPKFSDPVKHGQHVFQKYGCAACHGIWGTHGRRNFNALGPNQTRMEQGVEPTLVDTVGTYTHDELMKKIQDGVPSSAISRFKADGPTPPLYMPTWREKIKGQELDDLATYLMSIAKKTKTEEW